MRNEPNSAVPTGPTRVAGAVAIGAKRAKQTQFWPRQGEGQVACGKGVMTNWTCKEHWKNKANSRPGRECGKGRHGRLCKTNPIRRHRPGGFGETKPIAGGSTDARCPASAGARQPHRALGIVEIAVAVLSL